LQLCYGDGTRHSDQKGKGKNWLMPGGTCVSCAISFQVT
jgi:hypothetical protein